MAGVVMLFHSSMSRMNRTLPEVVDGESDPKTASWRAHHGAMTRRKTATAADRRRERDASGAGDAGRAPGTPAIDQAKTSPSDDQHEQAVVAGERGEPGEQAGQHERTPGMTRAT